MGLAAAEATLELLSAPDFYPTLLARAEGFYRELQEIFDRSPIPAHVGSAGAMFAVYLGTREPVTDYAALRGLDQAFAAVVLQPRGSMRACTSTPTSRLVRAYGRGARGRSCSGSRPWPREADWLSVRSDRD